MSLEHSICALCIGMEGMGVRFLAGEKELKDFFSVAKIRNHDVCSSVYETIALPLIDSSARIRFVCRNAHRKPSDGANIFDFNVAVAKAYKFFALYSITFNEPIDNHRLGKGFIIVLSAVNSPVKILLEF